MKLYEKPELTKVDILASERLMTSCIDGSVGPNDLGIPGVGCDPDPEGPDS